MTLLTRKSVLCDMLGRVSYDILNKKEPYVTLLTRKSVLCDMLGRVSF